MADLDEMYEDIEKRQKTPTKNLLRNISPAYIVIFGGIIILIIYFITKGAEMNRSILVIALIVALVVILAYQSTTKRVLTEQECKVILYQKLKWKQRHALGRFKEIPDGKIIIQKEGRLRFFDGEPWKREIGFKLETAEGLEDQYSAEVNPYTGDIISILPRPKGFDPKTRGDLKVIPSREMVTERQMQSYLGRMR